MPFRAARDALALQLLGRAREDSFECSGDAHNERCAHQFLLSTQAAARIFEFLKPDVQRNVCAVSNRRCLSHAECCLHPPRRIAAFRGLIPSPLITLIGYITAAQVANCIRGSATVLTASLPWHVRYVGFIGRLPSFEALITNFSGFASRSGTALRDHVPTVGRHTSAHLQPRSKGRSHRRDDQRDIPDQLWQHWDHQRHLHQPHRPRLGVEDHRDPDIGQRDPVNAPFRRMANAAISFAAFATSSSSQSSTGECM